MKEKRQKAGEIEARRKSCGYRIQLTCSNCVNCRRTFHAKGHVSQLTEAVCDYNGFDVNLYRGICKYFDNIGKYRT